MRIIVYKIPTTEKILYNLGFLLDKICKTYKIGVFCDKDNVGLVDKILWTFSSNIFLPHDIAGDDCIVNNQNPVLISCDFDKIQRKVVCVLTVDDLFFVKQHSLNCEIENIIYITQFDKDVEEIKLKNTNDVLDIFIKQNKQWIKV